MATDRRRQFIDQLLPSAKRFSQSTGIPAHWAIAMAANETGWDASNPVLFGIKGTGPGGQSGSFNTWEDYGAGRVDTTDQFATYSSYDEAFQHLASEMTSERWRNAPKDSAASFANYLAGNNPGKFKWATDPAYSTKVTQLVNDLESLGYADNSGQPIPPSGVRFGPPAPSPLDELENQLLNNAEKSSLPTRYRLNASSIFRQVRSSQDTVQQLEGQLAELRSPYNTSAWVSPQPKSQTPSYGDLEAAHYGVALPPPSSTPSYGDLEAARFSQPVLSKEAQKQWNQLSGQQAAAVAELQKANFLYTFLTASIGGWQSGEWNDFGDGVDKLLNKVFGSDDARKQQVKASLNTADLDLMKQIWGDVTQNVVRAAPDALMEEWSSGATNKSAGKPRNINQMTTNEIIRSLTGGAGAKPLPEGVTTEQMRLWFAKKGGDPDTVTNLASASKNWQDLADNYLKQYLAAEDIRIGASNPQMQQLDEWQTLKLALIQPVFVGAELFQHLLDIPYNALGMAGQEGYFGQVVQGGWAAPALGSAAALGATLLVGTSALAAPAIIGAGAIGYGLGAWAQEQMKGEVQKAFDQARARGMPEREAYRIAWEAGQDSNLPAALIISMGADPTNFLGAGITSKLLPAIPKFTKGMGYFEKGWLKFWDVTTPYMIGGIGGGMVGSAVGLGEYGVAAGLAGAAVRRFIPETYVQIAERTARSGGNLLYTVASNWQRTQHGTPSLFRPEPNINTFRTVVNRARAEYLNKPKIASLTEFGKLGRVIYDAGLQNLDPKYVDKISDLVGATNFRTLSIEQKRFKIKELMDILHGNVSDKPLWYKWDEQVKLATGIFGEGADPKKVGKWLRVESRSAWARGVEPIFNNNTTRARTAIEKFGDLIQRTTLERLRNPINTIEHAEGIMASIQRYGDYIGRVTGAMRVDQAVRAVARHQLLFLNFGPMNVLEGFIKLDSAGVNPFGFLGLKGKWTPTAMDTIHLLVGATTDLSNVRPAFRMAHDREVNIGSGMAALVGSPKETILGAKPKASGLFPFVTKPTPEVLRGLGRKLGPAGTPLISAAHWLDVNTPAWTHSLQNVNDMFSRFTTMQNAWYVLKKFQQSLAELDPVTVARIEESVGSVYSVQALKDNLDPTVLNSLQQYIRMAAFYGDPKLIDGLRDMGLNGLMDAQAVTKVQKVLSHFPQIGEEHAKVVLDQLVSGELRLDNLQDWMQRFRASWVENSIEGQLALNGYIMRDLFTQVADSMPRNPLELASLITKLQELTELSENGIGDVNKMMVSRGDEMSAAQRQKAWTSVYANIADLYGSVDSEATKSLKLLRDAIDQRQYMVDWDHVNWGEGFAGGVENPVKFVQDWSQVEWKTSSGGVVSPDYRTALRGLMKDLPGTFDFPINKVVVNDAPGNAGTNFVYTSKALVIDDGLLSNPPEFYRQLGQWWAFDRMTTTSYIGLAQDVAKYALGNPVEIAAASRDDPDFKSYLERFVTSNKRDVVFSPNISTYIYDTFGSIFSDWVVGRPLNQSERAIIDKWIGFKVPKTAQDEVKALIDSMPFLAKTQITGIALDPIDCEASHISGFMVTTQPYTSPTSGKTYPKGTLVLKNMSVLRGKETLWHEMGHDILQQRLNMQDTEFNNSLIDAAFADPYFHRQLGKANASGKYTTQVGDVEALKARISVDPEFMYEYGTVSDIYTMQEWFADNLAWYCADDPNISASAKQLFEQYYPKQSAQVVSSPAQRQLMRRWLDLQASNLKDFLSTKAQQDTFHDIVFVQGNKDLYKQELDKVRARWDKYTGNKIARDAEMRSVIEQLATTHGVPMPPVTIRPPAMGKLTASDVAYVWGSHPVELTRGLTDPFTLQLQSRGEWIDRQLAEANRLARKVGKTAEDFGYTKDELADVYDSLIRSISLDPATNDSMMPVHKMFAGLEGEMREQMMTMRMPAEVGQAWQGHLQGVKDGIEELFGHDGVINDNPAFINRESWHQTRQAAMDKANLEYSKDFPDYTNQNMFDSAMKGIFPFWTYEAHRYPWLIRHFVRHPNQAVMMNNYMNNTEQGYMDVPWPGGTPLQFNPLRGTIFGGGFNRLYAKDQPDYYDQFPEKAVGLVDTLGRAGFYPGAQVSVPMALFGGRKSQLGEVIPSWSQTFLGLIDALPSDSLKSLIKDSIFPDRFRDYRIISMVNEYGGDGLKIWNKRKRNDGLTADEQAVWNRASSYVSGVSATLDAQMGLFRLRGKERKQVYDAMSAATELLTGIPSNIQEQYNMYADVTGKRFTDVYPMDPLNQWLLNEYLSKYKAYLRPNTAPLLPGAQGEIKARVQDYYDEVDKVWRQARDTGFADVEGNITNPSAKQLEDQFRAGTITVDQYTSQLAKTQQKAADQSEVIGRQDYYKDVPKTRKEREAYYQKYNLPMPTWSPGQELLWEYYNIRPGYAADETGKMVADWDGYYEMIDALLEAMNPIVRDRFLQRVQAEWTDTQRLYWATSREYLRAYRNVGDVMLSKLQPDQQQALGQYRNSDIGTRQAIREDNLTPTGGSLINAYDSSVSTVRQNMRLADPELDAWLMFWGKTSKPLTQQSANIYNQLLSTYRPGVQHYLWNAQAS